MRSDITIGATFPNYGLPDQSGRRRKLSEIQGGDPMIVVLSRGHFCPKDRRQLRNLVELYPEIRVAYTRSSRSQPTTSSRPTRCATRSGRLAVPRGSRQGRPEGPRHR